MDTAVRPDRSDQPEPAAGTLTGDRLGIPAVAYFVMSGVAPETVAAGIVPVAFAVTGLSAGIPLAFVGMAVVLALWSVGYLALARHVRNAGAFYAFLARGVGRPAGVAAAMVALLAYNLLQVGLYGVFGVFVQGLMPPSWPTHAAPWWVFALMAWAVVALLGTRPVDVVAKILAAFATVELAVVLLLGLTGIATPAGGHLSFASLSPVSLFGGGLGALLAIAVVGFVGVESGAVFAEESRQPHRTVSAATYLSIAVTGLVYAVISFAMIAHVGDAKIVATATRLGPETLFTLGGGVLSDVARVLFATSLFAAMIAFHQAVGRYFYALGRDRVLPAGLGRIGRSGAPRNASLAQSAIGLAVIVLFAAAGWDPLVDLFFYLGTTGGLGVLLLIAATSFAVVGYFARDPRGVSVWRRFVAPALAGLLLLVIVVLVLDNYGILLNAPKGSPLTWLLPGLFGVAALAGVGWALVLRNRVPDRYHVIGLGTDEESQQFSKRHRPASHRARRGAVPRQLQRSGSPADLPEHTLPEHTLPEHTLPEHTGPEVARSAAGEQPSDTTTVP